MGTILCCRVNKQPNEQGLKNLGKITSNRDNVKFFMKNIFTFFVFACVAVQLLAGTNDVPVKLAIISESPDTGVAADVLTVEFSKNAQVQLLERAEIEKVYREQGLSAENQNYVKLGQILGADGLVLMGMDRKAAGGTKSEIGALHIQLVAVKPGVVIAAEGFSWPLQNIDEWSHLFAEHLKPLLPKLTVLKRDAIPISIVNFRYALQSKESEDVEQQLKLLAILRLSQERQLFVLERQRMQLLSEEKELKGDGSAFWDGSYLLEGIVDQNGYTRETISLNARLIPSKGGPPILIYVTGNRTNLADVVNRLSEKAVAALNVMPTMNGWSAADEAAHYFEEAKWALKWNNYSQAQAAAAAAWALGKRDEECADIQIESYLKSTDEIIVEESTLDAEYVNSTEESDRYLVKRSIKDEARSFGAVFKLDADGVKGIVIDNYPDESSLNNATRALELYYAFSQTLPPEEPEVKSRWYLLGVESLTHAAKVLQHYYLVPKSRIGVADKLADLRKLARAVADRISTPPSVQNAYYKFDAASDRQRRALADSIGVFQCAADLGCFWQETPEDQIALYRKLAASPAFTYLSTDSWGLARPRLIAWREEDRQRMPVAWDNFISELQHSTNLVLQAAAAFLKPHDAMALNEAEISAKVDDYWRKLGRGESLAIESQVAFLKESKSWNGGEFNRIFHLERYTQKEAMEIRPLLAAYRANATAQLRSNIESDQFDVAEINLKLANQEMDALEAKLEAAINPSAIHQAQRPAGQSQSNSIASAAPFKAIKDSLVVRQFLAMPDGVFTNKYVTQSQRISSIGEKKVLSHCWREGKLVLGLSFQCNLYNSDGSVRRYNGGGAAVLDPVTSHWEVVPYPFGQSREYVSLELFQGNLYLAVNDQCVLRGNQVGSRGGVWKCDLKAGKWEELDLRAQGTFILDALYQGVLRLYVISGHLFAANFQSILEIVEGGHGIQILASTRRRPTVSSLDGMDNLGEPTLFAGADHQLSACIKDKIYAWNGTDWRESFSFDRHLSDAQVDCCEDAIIFRKKRPASEQFRCHDEPLWGMQVGRATPELWLFEKAKPGFPGNVAWAEPPKPRWQLPNNMSLINVGVTYSKSNLYFFDDQANRTVGPNGSGTMISNKDVCPARLICLDYNLPEPIVAPLQFDEQQGRPPLSSRLPWEPGDTWLLVGDGDLYIGHPDTLGIWKISRQQLEAEIAGRKQSQEAQASQKVQAEKHADQVLIEKYDQDHNGVIDGLERENAIDDPEFIRSQLNVIDANRNGWLEARELIWFDANEDKILAPKEAASIDIACHLFAKKLMEQFDLSGKEWLNEREYTDLAQRTLHVGSVMPMDIKFQSIDQNHNQHVELGELEHLIQRHFMGELFKAQARQPGERPFAGRVDPAQRLKTLVENYWQHPVGVNSHADEIHSPFVPVGR